MNDKNLEFIVRDTNGDALGYYPKTPMEYANAGTYIKNKNRMLSMRYLTEDTSTCLRISRLLIWPKEAG